MSNQKQQKNCSIKIATKNNQPRQNGKADYLQFFTGNYLLINPQTD